MRSHLGAVMSSLIQSGTYIASISLAICSSRDIHAIDDRFAKICYMFDRSKKVKVSGKWRTHYEKYFHAQWYQPGSKLLLQETAHPRSLFPIDECDDIPLDSVYTKCSILGHGAEPDTAQSWSSDEPFFIGLVSFMRDFQLIDIHVVPAFSGTRQMSLSDNYSEMKRMSLS
jgi:hypothetical protein